jgi:phage shock protein C
MLYISQFILPCKMFEDKRLYRSRHDRMIAGVCGGLGEYFGVDPTLVRLLWVLFSFAGGAGVLAYVISYILIPVRPQDSKICQNCGEINLPDAIYCRNCGTLIKTEQAN